MTHNQSRNYLPPLDTPHRGTHGSSMDRGKTLCPQQLAQPRTTRDHQQGNGWRGGGVLNMLHMYARLDPEDGL